MLSCFILKALVCLCVCYPLCLWQIGAVREQLCSGRWRERETESEREFLAIVIWFGFGDRTNGDTRK
jgi:hypothetical protein